MSPKKKKAKLSESAESNKRSSEAPDSTQKRLKHIVNREEEIKTRKRKNFIMACELVSYRDYFNHRARLLLVCLPSCMTLLCKHHDRNSGNIQQMSSYADESFKTELKNNMWYEALEVCEMCITPTQYLSSDVLKEVVEIILNAHKDECSEYTVKHIIDKSQQILMQNFSTHPPCFMKSLRNCYKNFLTSPMSLKENTFTNRTEFECNKGIMKYCMNRLEHELSFDSTDGPLVDKDEHIPQEMKQSLRGLHWQIEKFEIFELLNRQERIERLFAVLEAVIELLQFDLAIWHSRYTNNLGCHIMRSHKPLMAYVLWSDNVLYTGAVTNNCRQILKIFSYMIHLQYPDSMVKTFALWLNTMVQTFYICEQNSNMDYPNTGKYCTGFANDFYKIISGLPQQSIIRILERIEPTFMRHLIGILHIQKILSIDECCILRILINFIGERQWNSYTHDNTEIIFSKKMFSLPKTVKRKINYLLKKSKTSFPLESTESRTYSRMEPDIKIIKSEASLYHIVHCLYITLDAYLDAYDIQSVQETWSNLNEQLMNESQVIETDTGSILTAHSNYSVTETLIKKYRHILKSIKELEDLFSELKKQGKLPEILNIFQNIKSIFL
ncbi:unnamed protein product [Arctia plantaginis]|uniref:Uncharacterized protein n=1 Tax=Arctia plantaginis TaxID=874455 RepID=A0A8S1A9Q5_ARCPL|nr:unnamed protein product [Arctia plantaginis]